MTRLIRNQRFFMKITSLSFCSTRLVSMFTENVIKVLFSYLFQNIFLKVDLKKTHYIIKHPKTLQNFSKHFIAQNLRMLNDKCIWWDFCILVPQWCMLLPVPAQTPISNVHLASFRREMMDEHSAVQSPGIQLKAEIHPRFALNWEILPGIAVAFAGILTYC